MEGTIEQVISGAIDGSALLACVYLFLQAHKGTNQTFSEQLGKVVESFERVMNQMIARVEALSSAVEKLTDRVQELSDEFHDRPK